MARRSTSAKKQQQRPQPVIPAVVPGPVRSNFGKNLVNWLFPAYVLMIATAYGLFLWKVSTGTDRCLFYSINAATLTGFQTPVGVDDFGNIGQFVTLALMTFGALFSLICGGLAIVRILRLPYSDLRVIGASFATFFAAAIIGSAGALVSGRGVFDSLFLAISSFSNCGLTTGDPPGPSDAITHLLLLPLSVVGGLGVTILLELFDRVRGRAKLSRHARVSLVGLASVYVIGFIVMLNLRSPGGSMAFGQWREALASNSALVLNSRSLGLPLEFATSLSRPVVWLLILLMTIGAASGGTAGGIKVTTFGELFTGIRRALRGERNSRGFGIALVWIGIYAAMVLVTQMLLLSRLPEIPADRLLFLAASAIGNVGMSHDAVSIGGDGLYLLSAAMFVGRVVPLLLLWWMADTTDDAELAIG